jgi:hypothetical protein
MHEFFWRVHSIEEAVVEMQSFFLLLYERASHLKTQISRQDYYRLFETIWKDRAEKAGWTLDIQYSKDENGTCIFHFRRGGEGELKEDKETK